jgi:hypothetical protein
MSGIVLLYIGSIFVFCWGVAHLFPTKNIVKGFGDISPDNKLIITMEWITEGIALIFIGVLTAFVAYTDQFSNLAGVVYWIVFGVLNVLSLVSLFTGFRHPFILFKLCPFIFTGSSLFIIIGSLLK